MQMNTCPFCGEKTRLGVVTKWLRIDHGYAKRGAYCRCKTCNARGSLVTLDEHFDVRNESVFGTKKDALIQKAVERWNGVGRSEPAGGLPLFDPSRLLAGRSSVTVEVRRLYGAEYEVALGDGVCDEASVKQKALSLAERDNTFENPEHLLGTTSVLV